MSRGRQQAVRVYPGTRSPYLPSGGLKPAPVPPNTMPASDGPIVTAGAIGLFILLFFSFGRVTDFFLLQLHLPFIVSLYCLLIAIMNRNLLTAFKSPVGMALSAFSIWLVLDVPFSVWRGGSFEVVSEWAKSFSLFVVTAALLPSLGLNIRAIKVLAYAFLTTSLLGFVYGRTQEGRFGLSQGLYSGSNELATAMALGCIFWWFMIHNPARSFPKRMMSIVPLIPLLIIMLYTASRAGLIVLGVLMIMVFFRYSMQGRLALIVVVVIAVTGGLAVLPSTARQRFGTIFGGNDDNTMSDSPNEALASSAQRGFLLKRSLALTLENPLFGVGPGQFVVAENSLAQNEGVRGQWLGTHNTYTQISSEGGIPAMLFFVASLYFCWRELRAAEKIHRSIVSPRSAEYLAAAYTLRMALASYAVFFCFEHIAYDPFYPAVAGMIVAFSRASRAAAVETVPALSLNRPSHWTPFAASPARAVR